MLQTTLYYRAPDDSLQAVLENGLPCGANVAVDPPVRAANAFLDRRCPSVLRTLGIERARATYCHLGVYDSVVDVETGDVVHVEDWKVGDDHVKLRVDIDPHRAFVSDLDLFDRIAERFATDRRGPESEVLAQDYWGRLVSLADLCAWYRQLGTALVSDYVRLERVEVLLTTDVAPERLRQLES